MDKTKGLKLAELLPDNLSEDTLNKIADTIGSFINDEVKERIKLLEAKTMAFIRGNVEKFKEQALSELTEENETYQDAIQFRKLKSLMGVDTVKVSEKEQTSMDELQEENETLIGQLNLLVEELAETQLKAKKYKKMYVKLNEGASNVLKENAELKENKLPFKSSEKGLMLTEERLAQKAKGITVTDNEFLSDKVAWG